MKTLVEMLNRYELHSDQRGNVKISIYSIIGKKDHWGGHHDDHHGKHHSKHKHHGYYAAAAR